jgi:hypothetical protein
VLKERLLLHRKLTVATLANESTLIFPSTGRTRLSTSELLVNSCLRNLTGMAAELNVYFVIPVEKYMSS